MRVVSLLFHDVYVTDPAESGFCGPAADRYKLSMAEFDRALDAIWIAWQGRPAPEPSTDAPAWLALTVDDGGVSYFLAVADRLEARGWRGHCFVTTGRIGQPGFLNPRQIRELDARGHVIGSHSASHPTRFSSCSWQQMVLEWTSSRSALEDVLGHPVRCASLPGGYLSRDVVRAASEAGLTWLFTSEPHAFVRRQHEVEVAGRFTVRPGFQARHLQGLVSQSAAAVWREQAVWTAKRAVKPLLGPIYPWLGATRLAQRRA